MTIDTAPGGLLRDSAPLVGDTYSDDMGDLAALEEAPPRRQPGQLVELLVEGEAPYTVRILNRDRIAYEKAAARHKEWPPAATGQNFAMTFVCWNAARRAGRTALTFEQFQNALEDYDVVGEAPADPTR